MPKQMIAAIRGSNVSDRGLLMIKRSDLDTGVMNGSGHILCLLLCFSPFFRIQNRGEIPGESYLKYQLTNTI